MVSLRSILVSSLSSLAALATIQPSSLVYAASLPPAARQASRSVNPHERVQSMVSQVWPWMSKGVEIYLSGTDQFTTLTERWQLFAPPTFIAVVVPKTEKDIEHIVQIANVFGLPWLAITGHHGAINSLGTFEYGIQISMENFNKITLTRDRQSALIGGGSLVKNITDTLWSWGMETVTGACECTSLVGPMLGGGHGWLQGRYGLAADQLIEARVILASGQLVTVSQNSYPDLFWGLRGAGHNFGIVTQVKYKVYEVQDCGKWQYVNLDFKQDKLEQVFDMVNKITNNGTGPVDYLDFVWYQRKPELDPQYPLVSLYMLYRGTFEQAQPIIDMYRALGPVNSTIIDTDYTQISSLSGNGNDGIACAHGLYSAMRFPTDFVTYNLTTNRNLYNKFADITSQQPGFNNSFFLFEDYSTNAVTAIDHASTAFPDRFNHHLASPVIIYFDDSLANDAVKAGQELRQIALDGKPGALNAYVNYAHGDETMEDWYGHESWRIQKLKALKRKYDPFHRLSYYAPIST